MGDVSASRETVSKPIVVVIGSTGTGKSSLCNILCGQDPLAKDVPFHVSEKVDACTFKTATYSTNWLGNGKKFTIVDTPGMDDPEGRDTEHIAEMVETLKQIKFVNAFIIVFNGQNPRIERSLYSMLKIFQGMFGTGFWKNTVIEFSRWSFSSHGCKMRKRQGITEEEHRDDWNKKFRSSFGLNHIVPTIFVDACYDPENDDEAKAFERETNKLWESINSFGDYECKDFEAVLAEMDKLMADKDKAVEQMELEEENRKRAEQTASEEKAQRELAEINAAKKADEAKEAQRTAEVLACEKKKAEEKVEKEKWKRTQVESQVNEAKAEAVNAMKQQDRVRQEAFERERQTTAAMLEAERAERERAAADARAERKKGDEASERLVEQMVGRERALAEADVERARRQEAEAEAALEREKREKAEKDKCIIS